MEKIEIFGGKQLNGEIQVQGSKNSSLPILAASLLVDGVSRIDNCPDLTDVNAAIKILEHLGCKVKREKTTVIVDSTAVSRYDIPQDLMHEMRSSIVFLGSILSRMGMAQLCTPGGCEIGLRPIDLHLSSLKTLGVSIEENSDGIDCKCENGIRGSVVSLSFPSVGATENIILASVFASGTTTILNAAREPEIEDLADFLNKIGCKVFVQNQGTVIIEGVNKAHGCKHKVISDRIVALTYMSAVAATRGDVILRGIDSNHFLSVLPVFEKAGCVIINETHAVRIISNSRLKALRDIRTMPYPGFPTDAQAPVMALACTAKGTSVIVENIFESRFKHVNELTRMGAKIKIEGKVAVIDGVKSLHGANVKSTDLRGGSALVVAGLAAKNGKTSIDGLNHIDRGYQDIVGCLKNVGAEIERIKLN